MRSSSLPWCFQLSDAQIGLLLQHLWPPRLHAPRPTGNAVLERSLQRPAANGSRRTVAALLLRLGIVARIPAGRFERRPARSIRLHVCAPGSSSVLEEVAPLRDRETGRGELATMSERRLAARAWPARFGGE